MLFWLFAHIFASREGLRPKSSRVHAFAGAFALEIGLITSGVLHRPHPRPRPSTRPSS